MVRILVTAFANKLNKSQIYIQTHSNASTQGKNRRSHEPHLHWLNFVSPKSVKILRVSHLLPEKLKEFCEQGEKGAYRYERTSQSLAFLWYDTARCGGPYGALIDPVHKL